jgi:hypothetical protein
MVLSLPRAEDRRLVKQRASPRQPPEPQQRLLRDVQAREERRTLPESLARLRRLDAELR